MRHHSYKYEYRQGVPSATPGRDTDRPKRSPAPTAVANLAPMARINERVRLGPNSRDGFPPVYIFSIYSCYATPQLQIRLPSESSLSYKGPLHKSPTPHPGARKTQESAGDRKGGGAAVVGGSGADGRCWQHMGSWWIGGFILQYEYRHKCLIFPHLLPQLERVGLRPSVA